MLQNKPSIFLIIITLSLIISGCMFALGPEPWHDPILYDKNTSDTGPARMLALKPDYKYRIREINTSEAKKYKVDVKEMLREVMEKALIKKDLLWNGSSEQKYYDISLSITVYEKGNALKRLLDPYYGSTVLGVHTDIVDVGTNQVITSMERRRIFRSDELLYVGVWRYVFNFVTNDIATDLKGKFSSTEDAFIVQLDPWHVKETEVTESSGKRKIHMLPFQDLRQEKNRIGERKTLNVSMGSILPNRDVLVFVREAVQNELLASGNSLSDEENSDVILSGELVKFWVQTPSTPLYWDIIGEVELKLIVSSRGKNKVVEKTYKAKGYGRTFQWPTEDLVTKVISDSVSSLMYKIRKDSIWTTL